MEKRTIRARALALAACVGLMSIGLTAHAQDEWWGRDKALHFGVSGVLAGGGYAVSSAMLESRSHRVVVGASVALGAGIAKEVYDELDYGGASYKDLVFDVAGVAVGVVAAWLIDVAVDDRNKETVAPRGGSLLIRF